MNDRTTMYNIHQQHAGTIIQLLAHSPSLERTANFARNNLGPPDANFAGSNFYASLRRKPTVNTVWEENWYCDAI